MLTIIIVALLPYTHLILNLGLDIAYSLSSQNDFLKSFSNRHIII